MNNERTWKVIAIICVLAAVLFALTVRSVENGKHWIEYYKSQAKSFCAISNNYYAALYKYDKTIYTEFGLEEIDCDKYLDIYP